MLMGINRRLGSEGGALDDLELCLRQHGGERLATLCADYVIGETASTDIDARVNGH